MSRLTAHLVQADLVWEDPPSNFALVERLLGDAGVSRGDLIVLPELFDTGFSFALERTSDTDERTLRFVCGLARAAGAYVHGSRTLVAGDGRGRNMAVIAGPDGGLIGEYAKMHPFSFGREAEHFEGGDDTLVWRTADGVGVGVAVCYDLRFPELFRRLAIDGAEVLALGANWPAARQAHWRALLIARAIENQAYVLGVNRCGADPHLEYAGGTIAVSPMGEVLGELGDTEGVLTVGLDLDALRAWREKFPALRDIRMIERGGDA